MVEIFLSKIGVWGLGFGVWGLGGDPSGMGGLALLSRHSANDPSPDSRLPGTGPREADVGLTTAN